MAIRGPTEDSGRSPHELKISTHCDFVGKAPIVSKYGGKGACFRSVGKSHFASSHHGPPIATRVKPSPPQMKTELKMHQSDTSARRYPRNRRCRRRTARPAAQHPQKISRGREGGRAVPHPPSNPILTLICMSYWAPPGRDMMAVICSLCAAGRAAIWVARFRRSPLVLRLPENR